MPLALVNKINLNYKVEGKGEPLVLIGGFNSERITWLFQTFTFKKHFRVITFENRGSGKSDKPKGPYSIQIMAADTLALMDFLDIQKTHILGVSLGGLIAQEIAINNPERVSRLIIGTSYSHIDRSNGPTDDMIKFTKLPIRKMLDPMAGLMLNRKLFRTLLLPLAGIKNKMADIDSIQAKLEAAYNHNTQNRLGTIKCLTLVITGDEDRVIKPTSSEEISTLIPNARLVKIPNSSHMLFIERSGKFNQTVLEFLLDR
jgi:3-oxoadipate enol-lactonase